MGWLERRVVSLGMGVFAAATGWSQPGPRYQHTAVWTGSEMIVFGSLNPLPGAAYDPSTDGWRWISTVNEPGSEVFWHSAIWTGTEMIVWGGVHPGSAYTNEGGRYDPLASPGRTRSRPT